MEIALSHLRMLLSEAAQLGATYTLPHTGVIKPFLTQAEAFRQYGRTTVESWG
jgi:hypothetical protein